MATPATRLIELQREITWLQNKIADLEAQKRGPLDRLNRFYRLTDTSFGGIAMAQQWADLWMWEAILNDNKQLRAIFEIGTWRGGLSWWLWAQCEARRKENEIPMHFETYDSIEPDVYVPNFTRVDVFAEYAMLGVTFRTYEPCLVFCDGGNKPRELKIFAEQLEHPESLFIVHDWGTEFTHEDIPASVRMVYGDFCEDLGALSRVFRLQSEDA